MIREKEAKEIAKKHQKEIAKKNKLEAKLKKDSDSIVGFEDKAMGGSQVKETTAKVVIFNNQLDFEVHKRRKHKSTCWKRHEVRQAQEGR